MGGGGHSELAIVLGREVGVMRARAADPKRPLVVAQRIHLEHVCRRVVAVAENVEGASGSEGAAPTHEVACDIDMPMRVHGNACADAITRRAHLLGP